MQTTVTRQNVVQDLQKLHGFSEAEAFAAVETHKDIVETGIRAGSHTYYVVTRILEACGHECSDQCIEDEEA